MPARLLIWSLTLLCVATGAQAASYEEEQLVTTLEAAGLEEALDVEEKPIAFVRIFAQGVFVPGERWPLFLNALHVQTREEVIARELRFRVGELLARAPLEESARILRSLAIFSLVRVVAVREVATGTIGVAVFTRDLWSLRLEQSIQFNGGQLDALALQLTERNLFGRDKAATVRFSLVPHTHAFGALYDDPRLFGGELAFSQSADLFFATDEGELDGGRGELVFGRPLRTLSQRHGFELHALADTRVVRQLRDGEIAAYDDPRTSGVESIDRTFRQRSLAASILALHQLEGPMQHRFGAGLGARKRLAEPLPQVQLTRAQDAAFRRDVLPRSWTSIYPTLAYAAFRPTYRSFVELDSYGLLEEVRTGPDFSASIATPLALLGSTADAVVTHVGAGYLLAGGDALLGTQLELGARVEAGELTDRVLLASLRAASPRFFLGRLVARARAVLRREQTERTLVTLGGDNGLRGHPSQALFGTGASVLQGNVELRSPPMRLRSLHVGTAAFYDAGALGDSMGSLVFRHAVGFGLRFLVPQLNRSVYRLDLALPLGGDGFAVVLGGGSGPSFAATFTDEESVRYAP